MENRRITRAIAWLHRLEAYFLVGAFLLMLVTAVVQIVARNASGTGLFWGDALVRVLVLWVALLGGMAASLSNRHIHIDLLDHYLGAEATIYLNRIKQMITAVICVALAYASWSFVVGEFDAGARALGRLPSWVFASILPFGFIVMALRHLLSAFFHASQSSYKETSA